MSNALTFRDPTSAPPAGGRKREPSALAKALSVGNSLRRIQTNANGTFRRVKGSEPLGKAIQGEFRFILVDALPKVSRTFYAAAYDPNATPTLPDCWSNLGDVPDVAAPKPQHSNCADCKQNIAGSGDGGRRACRFNRRIAILLDGDPSGEVYQFNIPAKSLFGKGDGNGYPFESYIKHLIGNGANPDMVVTSASYNLDADTMEILFSPVRYVTDKEYALVEAAQADPETKQYIQLTVAQAQGATAAAEAPAPKAEAKTEPKAEPKSATKAAPASMFDDGEEEPIKEPVRRASKRPTEPVTTDVVSPELSDVLKEWGE